YRGDVILQMDAMVGELMRTLKNLDLEKNTIVIFSSDNGPVLDDGYQDESSELAKEYGHDPMGGLRGGKYSMFEGGTRMPFIVYWPEEVESGESDALVSQMDLLGSFAHFLNVDLGESDAVDSQNMWDAFTGKSKEGRDSYVVQNNGAVLGYIKNGWKYIEAAGGPAINKYVNIENGLNKEPKLYNLKEDAKEQHNLAAEHHDKVKEMAAELDEIRRGKGTR